MTEPRPPARECLHCESDALIEPERAELPQSRGATVPAWRYHCRLCGATRLEPAR